MNANEPSPMVSQTATPHPVLRIVLPVVIMALGVGVTVVLVTTRRPPQKRPARERVAVVEVVPLARSREPIVIQAAGTVIPREAIPLQPRVSGEVVRIDPHFVPGGKFDAGEILLELDPADYHLTATNRLADLIRARANLDIEQGLQEVASNEWATMQTLGDASAYTERDRGLALRTPQQALAEAAVTSAQAALERAQLDLERTRIRAPFNAVIRERHVNVGAQVTPQTVLAQLAGTDACWVTATLPATQARWLDIPNDTARTPAPSATIHPVAGAAPTAHWQGRVLRRLPDLEPQGRQVQILVEVPRTPAAQEGDAALPLGTYVRVDIEGPVIEDVFRIPRKALREGQRIWLIDEDNRLDIREVRLVWTDGERALIRDGINAGERLVVSDIAVPVAGMRLQIHKEKENTP